jgi:hypothetical protein
LAAACHGALSAQDRAAPEACSLSEPLWAAAATIGSDDPRGWTTGRRDDVGCRLFVGGWASASYSGSFEVQRPDGLAAPAAGAVVAASAGLLLRRGALEIRVLPEVAWHQNNTLDLPESTFADNRRYGYPWAAIDWPLQFGPSAFTLAGPGRSGVRLHFGRFSAGIDAEPVRWGPSRRYPLLLSGQQASLPRVGLRTEEPLDLGSIGKLDANLLYAHLTSSDWFSASAEAEDRIMGGLVLAWRVGFLPGLELGAASLYHRDADDFNAGAALGWIQPPAESAEANDEGNGIGNYWLRWSRPGSGFDVWVEWMKDDYNPGFGQLLLEPEHGVGRTFGIRQEVPWGDRRFALHFESVTTRNTEPLADDDDGSRTIYYTHGQVREGHTQRGQMLGAVVGPGGDGEFVEVSLIGASTTRIQLERMRFNTDTYTEVLGQPLGDEGYDVELVARISHDRPIRGVLVRATAEAGARHNRLFLQETSPSWDGNVRLGVMLMWSR